MLMQRLHKINQGDGIKIAFGKFKHQMAPGTDCRGDSNPNTFLARNSDNWTNLGKRPSLAHIRNQKEKTKNQQHKKKKKKKKKNPPPKKKTPPPPVLFFFFFLGGQTAGGGLI